MMHEPRHQDDYSARQVEAARRVLIDLGQVLASYVDCLVVIGGWVPDLLLPSAEEPHIGSIDVDIALDARRLQDGRYADMLKLLLENKRYRHGVKDFQFIVEVDLQDGGTLIEVEVEFLADKEVKLKRRTKKMLEGFRVLQADACGVAFHAPVSLPLTGKSVRGAKNTVCLRVASLADFMVMKAHAIAGRDKPKDSYDLCYCLENSPAGIEGLAHDWQQRLDDQVVKRAVEILRAKFASVADFGPQQVVEFHAAQDLETQAMQARRAYELVRRFLELL
ncbi:MAG: nucleotidyl transferase AbiEii/AbiGii toxin family protein [Prosthecobacter sp.]